MNDLKSEIPEALIINEENKLEFLELRSFVENFYSCEYKFKQVELCLKNK